MPGVTRDWPEGRIYAFDRIYDSHGMGYRGPGFGWAPMPDQYALEVLQREELSRTGRPPVMAELPMVSSHHPWERTPGLVPWTALGDGSVFAAAPAANPRPAPAGDDVRANYRRSVEYSLTALLSWVRTYGTDRTVVVFLGDHQPTAAVTGDGASRD